MSFDYCPTCHCGTVHIDGWYTLHPRTPAERPDTTPYPSCALGFGMKAQFWRSYFATNLHQRIETRSPVDCILRELELVEATLVAFLEVTKPQCSGVCWWCGAQPASPLYVTIDKRKDVVVCNEVCQEALAHAMG